MFVATAAIAFSVGGCHRSSTPRASDQQAADSARAGERLPLRAAPQPPPLLPVPETLLAAPIAHRGGTLRVHLDGEPTQLNPLFDPDASTVQIVSGLVYETMLDCPSPGTTGGYRPALAESWQVSPDGLRVTFRTRPGVKWHDGFLFGPLDVQTTLESLLIGGGDSMPVLRASVQDIASVEIAADRVVRLLLKRPSDMALRALCDIPILPSHITRGGPALAATLARQPVGTGPFRFAGWDKGKRVRLTHFAGYWGEAAGVDEIAFEIDGDGARALGRTRRGEIDILPHVLSVHYPDEVDEVTLHGTLGLWRMRTDRWAYVAVNHRRAPLGDAPFRRALSALWDRDRFVRDLHKGLARSIAAPPCCEAAVAASGRAAAAGELDLGGYRDTDADGVRELDGKPIRLTLLATPGGRAAAEAHAFILEARKAGVLIDLVPVDAPTMFARVKKRDFDLALMLWEGRPDEDPTILFSPIGPLGAAGYRSAEADAMLDSLRRAVGPGERQPLLASLGALLARDQPALFLYQFDVAILVASRVHGVSAVGDRLDLRRAWLDP